MAATRKTRRRPPRKRSGKVLGFLIRVGLLLALAVGLGATLYGIHLDRVVRAKFEGQRWALPARVYARPLELYAGRQLTADEFEQELQRLNYRRLATPDSPGSYDRDGEQLVLRTRPFRFWDGRESSRGLRVRFDNHRVSAVEAVDGGPDPALVRLDAMLIASIYPTHNEDRILVRRKELPELLVHTLYAVEDRSFERHLGVDPRGIARAAYSNLMAGGVVEGASTLTQQLVKNFYLSAERTLERKLKEAFMAVLLERRYTKGEILEAYANEIYLGQDGSRAIHGFGLASRFYFNKSLADLDVAETALLVGMVQAPSSLDPRRRPEAALKRRNLVLDVMVRDGVVDAATAAAAKDAPLGVVDGGGRPAGEYPAFITLVRRQLQRDYRDEDLRSEGLNIFTTLDPLVQTTVERSVPERLGAIESARGKRKGSLEAAAVVTSVAQGEVLALVGGRDSAYAGFNRALDSVRSIGSLVKPVVYLTALTHPERYSLSTIIEDKAVSIPDGTGSRWEPSNYSHRVYGKLPLYEGLVRSLNLATVNLGMDLGVDEVVDNLYRLGAQRRISAVPAMLLGAVNLSPLEVAQVYQSIAAGGYRSPLRAIREVVDAEGRPLNRYPLAVESVVDPHAAYLTTWAMERVVERGTAAWLGRQLPDGMSMAGKTGTTNGLRDSWFAGFSGDKVAVVWVGRDDFKPMGLTGSSGALRVWGDFMLKLENEPLAPLRPEGVVTAQVCDGAEMPYVADYVPSADSCGGDESAEQQEGEAVAEGPTQDEPPAQPQRSRPAREQNLFMSDFYD
ncbi:penicillin-binding protein 1B [Marichromatium purpuratum 984]|uniref:Penicillin-binding protein 1B n=1 Tax=Marichromatium purpuratum 984 TaxID=765910 RepID=W0E109_MARPU|nr:penicillin-binding protein 1B [Marichromatium purpuratum]AHF02786.1 penicillin-binding protein 1B [Marichromatium purpuratum 984]